MVAQDADDTTDLISLAIRAHVVGTRDPAPSIRFDPRILELPTIEHPFYPEPITIYELGEPRDTAVTNTIVERIGAELGDMDTDRVCEPESPDIWRVCTLPHAFATVAASEPEIKGDTATVVLQSLTRIDDPRGLRLVSLNRVLVILERSEKGWVVRGGRNLYIT